MLTDGVSGGGDQSGREVQLDPDLDLYGLVISYSLRSAHSLPPFLVEGIADTIPTKLGVKIPAAMSSASESLHKYPFSLT